MKKNIAHIPFQSASLDTWQSKYQLCPKSGDELDSSIEDTYQRVARALSVVEPESKRSETEKQFLWALKNGAIPAGRIVSNAGVFERFPRVCGDRPVANRGNRNGHWFPPHVQGESHPQYFIRKIEN